MSARPGLGLIAGTAIAAGLIGALASLGGFLLLDNDAPERGGVFFFANLDEAELEGAPLCETRNAYCLTLDDAGEIIAVYPFETNSYYRQRGCEAEWLPDMRFRDPRTGLNAEGWFRGRCGGGTYDIHGNRVFGPVFRNLDRFPVRQRADGIEVDTRRLICGKVPAGDPETAEAGCEFAPPPA
jgi:hypothetical protein